MDEKKLCFICEKQKVGRNINKFFDEELGLQNLFNEIFKINIEKSKNSRKLKICNVCIQELKTCQVFYQRVKKAQERIIANLDVDTLPVKVEIKQEPEEVGFHQLCYAQDFDFFQSFEANDDDSSNRDDLLEEIQVKRKKHLKTSSAVSKSKDTRSYNKLTPEERKQRGNRGMRRAKEAIKITTESLYKKELRGKYIEPPEELQIPAEDKLKHGFVSERITQSLAPSSWPIAYEWKCTEVTCAQIFPNVLDLNLHLHKAHRIKYRTTCSLCLKPTQHYAAFLNHIIEQHVPNNRFCCIVCPQPVFIWNFKDMYNHYHKFHKLKNLNFCLYCGAQFFCGARLKEHLIHKHNKENDRAEEFFCDFCGFRTELRSRIKSHMVRHVMPTHLCYLCSATFTDSGYLSTHLRQVHSELQVQCPKCEKVFKTHKRLRCHFQTVHEEDKPFLCEICNKRFAARHRLNIHLKIHQDQREERYQCAYCERRFKYKPGMIYHERAAHTGLQPYKCPIDTCHERFYDFSNAKKHINGRHNSSLRPILEHI